MLATTTTAPALPETETQDHRCKHITVTEHPQKPCSGFFEDIFKTVTVECRDPEHNLSLD